ncbi:MAG: phytase [Planctomycetota bacterium]
MMRAAEPDPVDAFADSGLVELLALDNEGTLLALERSFSVGAEDRGYTGKLYLVRTQGATNVIDFDAVPTEIEDGELEINVDEVATKELLADLSEFDIVVDNVEGLAFGPELADGRQSLIIVSDDNFSAFGPQATQFVALALDLGTVPTVTPVLETPDELRFPVPGDDEEEEIVEMPEAPAEDETPTMEEEAPAEENEEVVEDAPTDETEAVVPEGPDADDPAIWLNPDDPADSVVITALKNGGLRVYDLAGEEIQSISPNGIRYNNVDVLYGVGDPADPRDLAVVSDRANDTLAIFEIGPDGMLTDVTAPGAPETIFGVDDGEATAYGLTTYSSPIDGRDYAFVTQADGARISQLELLDDGDTVTYRIVRELTLPVPEGEDPADFQSEGIVIDRETGIGYVAVEEELGLLSFDAELGGSDDFETVAPIDSAFFSPDLEGVAIYYGENGDGLIVASSQGDSTFAAFDRASGDFVGSFAITGQEQPEDDMSDDEMLTDEVPVEEMPDGEMTTEEMPVEEVALVEDEPAEPVDPVVETDGLEIFSGPLPGFDQGLLVTQDGSNEPAQILPDPEDGEIQNFNTNFKYTDLGDVLEILDTPSNEDFDPRAPAVLQENQTEASLEDDVLQGTDFADVFVFARGDSTPENTDTVSGFGPGDMVDLSAFSFVEIVPGADPMEGRVGVYETGDGVMVFGNTGRSEDFMLEIENVTMETAMAALVL